MARGLVWELLGLTEAVEVVVPFRSTDGKELKASEALNEM
jgi:hypothetical protein